MTSAAPAIEWPTPRQIDDWLPLMVSLLESRHEVSTEHVPRRLRDAEAVAIIMEGPTLCSMGAIKSHSVARAKTMASDFQEKEIEGITAELGYIATDATYEGHGFAGRIVDALLQRHAGPLFATVRSSNTTMQGMLERRRFTPVGLPKPSTMHVGTTIQAFLRNH